MNPEHTTKFSIKDKDHPDEDKNSVEYQFFALTIYEFDVLKLKFTER